MEESQKAQKIIIGYCIFKADLSFVQRVLSQLKEEYFDGDDKVLWKGIYRYYLKTGAVMNLTVFREIARAAKLTEARLFALEQELTACEEIVEKITDREILWFVNRLADVYKEKKFGDALAASDVKLKEKGFTHARDLMLMSMSELDDGVYEKDQDGDLKKDIDEVIREAATAQDERTRDAVDFGLAAVDDKVLGMRSGDLCLAVAYTGIGKTTLMVNVAVDVAYRQKKNVVYATTETVRKQLRRRLISCASKLPMFETPIASRSLKQGMLSEGESTTLLHIKEFLNSGSHGYLYVVQVPSNGTVAWLRGKLLQIESQMGKVDLCILDDLRNLRPPVRRKQEYEEYNDLIKEIKGLARTHAGRGVPLISPYQVNRTSYQKALENGGHYDLTALASSSEAEKTSDLIFTLWADPDTSSEVTLEFLKLRDGKGGEPVRLRLEGDFQKFTEVRESGVSDFMR
jgi:replicative DNA helicase